MEAGDIYTEPLRDDEEDGGRKRTGSSVGGGLRRLSGRMSSLSGSGSLSPGRLAGQFFSFDDELVLGGSDDEPDGEDSSRQTRGSSTLRRLSRRLSGGSLGRLSEIILSQITDEISSCDDDDADDDADDEVDEEEMRPGRQRGRRQQERRRSNSQGSRPPPQRRSSAATAASRASDDSSWAVGEAYDRAVRRLSRRSSLPLVRPASVTPSSTAIRAAQSSPAAAAAGRRISLPSPGPAGSSIGVGIGIHGHRRFRGEGAGSTSRWSSCPSAASASTCTRSTGPKSSGEESSVRDSIIHAAEGGSSSSPSSSQSSLRYWEIDGLERLLGGGGGGGDGSSRRVGSAHPNGDVGQKETILEYYVSKERAEVDVSGNDDDGANRSSLPSSPGALADPTVPVATAHMDGASASPTSTGPTRRRRPILLQALAVWPPSLPPASAASPWYLVRAPAAAGTMRCLSRGNIMSGCFNRRNVSSSLH